MALIFTDTTTFEKGLLAEHAGQPEEAERLYHAAIAEDPRQPGPYERLGLAAMARPDNDAALAWFEAALKADPTFAPALVNTAFVLDKLGRRDEAWALLGHTVTIHPSFAAAHFLQGQMLWDIGDYKTACECMERGIRLAPEFAGEHANRCYEDLSRCDWRGYEELKALTTRLVRSGAVVVSPLVMMYQTDNVADLGTAARFYAAANHPRRAPLWTGGPRRPGKIRIGYMSSDFRNHAVGHLIAGVMENHDREAFEVFAYSCAPPDDDDAVRERIIDAVDHFMDVVELTDLDIARLVRDQEIDILLNLNGYTLNGRTDVMTGRPAPVQVNFQGYPGTLGAPYIDYMIADRHVIPTEHMPHYSEKVVWMPDTYQPTNDKEAIAQTTPTRAELGLPETGFVFLGYNHQVKISPAIFASWMRILERTPGSVLWLGDGGPDPCENLRIEARERGIDPARLVFLPKVDSRAENYARQRAADLYLDTLPYNAHSRGSDALWVGLPVLTCKGEAFAGRVGAGLLEAAGFPELVTHSLAEYEDLAVALAHDPVRLAALRARVEAQAPKSALFQTARYTRHLEAAFRTMFDRAQAGLPPEAFAVAPLP